MKPHTIASIAVVAVVLGACSGGGGGISPSSSNPTTTGSGASPQVATGTLMIGNPSAGRASNVRKPAYVSVSSKYATLWIDGSVTGVRSACTNTSTSTPQPICTINWTSTSGPHTFTVEVDDGTISGGGTVLAAGSASETLIAGLNTLSNITVNGVVVAMYLVTEALVTGNACATAFQAPGNCFKGTVQFLDGDYQIITLPGNYDQTTIGGPILMQTATTGSANSIALALLDGFEGVLAPGSDSTVGFEIYCVDGSTGTFTLYANYANATTGELSQAQLNAYSLSYPTATNIPGTDFPTYACNSGVVASVGPANGSVTVQSTQR
jgi:hypothetical protein